MRINKRKQLSYLIEPLVFDNCKRNREKQDEFTGLAAFGSGSLAIT